MNNTMKYLGIFFVVALLAAGCGSNNNGIAPLAAGGGGVTIDQAAGGVPVNSASALDINDNNVVVGFLEPTAGATFQAAAWNVGAAVTPRSLDPIAGNAFSAAYAVDDEGKAIGQSSKGTQKVAVYWPAGASTPVELPALNAAGNSGALGISADGSCIVGDAQDAGLASQAVIWIADAGGNFTSPPVVLPVSLVGSAFSSANGVARAGAQISVAGVAEDRLGVAHAMVWTSTDGGAIFSAADLRTAGEAGSQAMAVNASGKVVGEAETAPGVFAAVLWDNTAAHTRTILAENGTASAINDAGKVVGTASGKATVWNTAVQGFAPQTLFATASSVYGTNNGDATGNFVVGVNGGKGFVKKVN
ncbi:MAG: hypothetical protein AB1346_04635 [Thermodesulfobacteriota bacterium]